MTIIKVGGSILQDSSGNLNRETVREYSEIIQSNESKIDGLVFGGGRTAKKYIDFGNKFRLSDEQLDQIGIYATHMHAGMMSQILGENYVFRRKISSVDSKSLNTPIMGGTEPGQTTDGVSLLLSDRTNSDKVVIATDIDGIYDTRNDTMIDEAERFDVVSTDELKELLNEYSDTPGRSIPIDKRSVELVENNGTEVVICDGRDVSNIRKAINSEDVGTRIVSD